MQRRLERGVVSARSGVKPVPLKDAVVERRVGVPVVRVDLMEGPVCGRAIVLVSIRLQDRAVLTVAQGHLIPGLERDRRRLHVRGRQRGVAVV